MSVPSLLVPAERRFPSKIDAWLALLGGLACAFTIGAAVVVALSDAPVWLIVVLAITPALLAWVLVRTAYDVTASTLVVRSGPFRWTIPLDSMQSLAATRSTLSAPALSLDRIVVRHTGGELLVSPKDKAGFVATLLTRAPHLSVSGLPVPSGLDLDDAPLPPRAFNLAAIVPAMVIGTAGIAFAAFTLYAGTQPPAITLSPDALTIDGLYSTTLARDEIVRLTLDDRLPATSRRSGFSARGHLRGDFDVEGLGRCRLFVTRHAPPYLVIYTTTRPVIVNYENADRTRALYERLLQHWR